MLFVHHKKGFSALIPVLMVATMLFSCGGDVGGLNETAGGITLSAEPSTIPADGASSTTINAIIRDSSGQGAPLGTVVTFKTNLGRFLNGAQEHSLTVGSTDGSVLVSLIAGTTVGYAEVTCTSGGTSASTIVTIGASTPPGKTAEINLTAAPNPIEDTDVPPDTSNDSTTITATLTDAVGDAVDDGTSAVFTTTRGNFLNESKTITGYTSDGLIEIILKLSSETAEVSCSSNNVTRSITIQHR
jgi:hypothetical protein